ncbi:nucleotidyltransferase family protein [Candidatus Binatia bacterium]|jgi:hypothetical protein|nr:nucleotidyltransferase family protein [Candidatus Binatia bacterium]
MSIADYVAIAKQIGFGRAESVVGALAALPGSAETVADTLRSHHLLGFAQRAVREADAQARVAPELCAALASRRPIQRAAPEALLRTFEEVRRTLAAAGIEALLLKGLWLAQRLYGGIDRRPQFDVDVLVRRRELRRAARVLGRAGFAPQAYDLHSRTVIRDDLKVDLHGSLRWAPAYRLEEDVLWTQRREVSIAGVVVPTLSDEHTLLLLVLAAFEDLGQGTTNLKQLLDLALLVRELDSTSDWKALLERRTQENLLAVSVNVFAVILDVFEMHDAAPRLTAALTPHAGCIRHPDRTSALTLLGAAPKSAASLRWYARVYPGSMVHWLAWFWASGFPANLRQVGGTWLSQAVAVGAETLRARRDA